MLKIQKNIFALSLLALSLLLGNTANAQIKSFSSYLEKLPDAGSLPSDAILETTSPDSLEKSQEIHQLEAQLENYVRLLRGEFTAVRNDASQANAVAVSNTQSGNIRQQSDPPPSELIATAQGELKDPVADTLLALAKTLQELKIAFDASYKAITDVHIYRTNVANAVSNQLQKTEPCNADPDCITKHRKARNHDLSEAGKDRIIYNLSLVASQIRQLKPLLAKIDVALPKPFPKAAKAKAMAISLSENARNILIAVSEQIKLQRIFIAECAKLMQAK